MKLSLDVGGSHITGFKIILEDDEDDSYFNRLSKELLIKNPATNSIESLNSSYRRLNRQRSVFPSSQALLKALYLATFEATKKWTMPLRNWGKVYGELSIKLQFN